MRAILVLGLMVALTGCAATGTPYRDHPAYTQPVPGDLARVVVYRLDQAQNSTVMATMEIDGLIFGTLRENGFVTHDVDTRTHALRADIPSESGTCQLTFQIAAGETGYFLVAPRSENSIARTPGSIAGAIAPTWLALAITVAAENTGAALESAGKRCGGPFSVVRILPAAAQSVIMDLRESTQ